MDPEIDIIVTDDDLKNILPLGKQGCDNCAPLSYYCDECTRKIYAAQQSVQPDDYNAVPTIIKSFPMRDAYPVGHKNRRR